MTGKKQKKKQTGKNPKKISSRKQATLVLKETEAQKKTSVKAGKKTDSAKTGSVLKKFQKQVATFKKKFQVSLTKPHLLKQKTQKPAEQKSQLLKKTTQKSLEKKPQSLKKTTQKPPIEKSQPMKKTPSLRKETQKTGTETPKSLKEPTLGAPLDKSMKTQKEVGMSSPSVAQKPLKRATPSQKASAVNKLDLAKKELKIILEREKEEKLILKDMEGRSYCCVEDCGFSAVVEGYCRLHYMGHWEYITKRNKILKNKVLEKFINQMITDHSENILNYLLQDLKQEKIFTAIVKAFLEEDEEIESEDTLLG